MIPNAAKPALRALRRKAYTFMDVLLVNKGYARLSTELDGKGGIQDSLDAPLIAWLNYHDRKAKGPCQWLGSKVSKNPMDNWIYQEILYEVRPDLVIEIGNKVGGTTLFLAGICELMDHGRVLAMDTDHTIFTGHHPRVELLTGDCGEESIVAAVKEKCVGQKVLIIHDASHTKNAVLRDLRNYCGLVSPGSYFIVEDCLMGVPGIVNDSGDQRVGSFKFQTKDTPMQAVEDFLQENGDFEVDRSRERYILTTCVGGYLRRVG